MLKNRKLSGSSMISGGTAGVSSQEHCPKIAR